MATTAPAPPAVRSSRAAATWSVAGTCARDLRGSRRVYQPGCDGGDGKLVSDSNRARLQSECVRHLCLQCRPDVFGIPRSWRRSRREHSGGVSRRRELCGIDREPAGGNRRGHGPRLGVGIVRRLVRLCVSSGHVGASSRGRELTTDGNRSQPPTYGRCGSTHQLLRQGEHAPLHGAGDGVSHRRIRTGRGQAVAAWRRRWDESIFDSAGGGGRVGSVVARAGRRLRAWPRCRSNRGTLASC